MNNLKLILYVTVITFPDAQNIKYLLTSDRICLVGAIPANQVI